MSVEKSSIRALCTDAVFERGQRYRDEGRIQHLDRFGDTVTAQVQGSSQYDIRLDLASEGFAPQCTCPYSGPGECKHVVAVLLAVAEESPADESDRLDAVLADVSASELRAFLREEVLRDHAMRERFFATFGEATTESKAPDAYREQVDQLFEQHADPVVVEAIDFSHLTDLGQRHRDRGRDEQAAFIYRGLAEGIAANMHLVDANYDHYSTAFQSALDQYLACLREASLDEEQRQRHVDYLASQARERVDYLAERYAAAREDLQSMQ